MHGILIHQRPSGNELRQLRTCLPDCTGDAVDEKSKSVLFVQARSSHVSDMKNLF